MIELLNIPEFRQQVAPISVETFHRMIETGALDETPCELIEGALIEKMSKSELHVFLVRLLFRLLSDQSPENCFVQKEDPITLDVSEPEPDISVIEGDWRSAKKPTTALFIIEVSISTLTIDRAKAPGFARAGVPEFWIVRPDSKAIEVFRRPEKGEYLETKTVPAETTLDSSAIPSFSFNLAEALTGV
ncbi:MAG: Uma2 family endonuclease [Verrucomicrobiota bacterium]